MCSRISWHQFILTLLFLAVGYYLIVIVFKYRKEIARWIKLIGQGKSGALFVSQAADAQPEKGRPGTAATPAKQPIDGSKKPVAKISEAKIYTSVHELTHDLHIVFTEYANKKKNKPELLGAIKRTLSDYLYLQGTAVEAEIIQHIAGQAKEICSIDLSKDDLSMLWKE